MVTTATPTLARNDVISLFTRLLEAWNARNANTFAALFTENGNTVGFDGSPLDGRAAIAKELGGIFRDHPTAAYVAKVREVRDLGGGATLLRAVASMLPPGKSELKPERNVIQSLVAVMDDGTPKIALFQNTPAKFDGRPQMTQQLTQELTDVLRSKRVVDAG